jgi:para-aminobenzoate synthetase/4-amino-4-deoxychorismate lyase
MNWGDNFVLLETLRRDKHNKQNLLFTHPVDIVECRHQNKIQSCFRKMEKCLQEGFYLAGFFSYELGYYLEEAFGSNQPPSAYPLIWLGVYHKPRKQRAAALPGGDKHFYLSMPSLAVKPAAYTKAIGTIKNLIASGETYQINYTSKYSFNFFGDVFHFYQSLKDNQQVSYSALLNHGDDYIISLSPELFFRIDRQRNITVRPMKGTAPVNTPPAWLSTDPKNTSENVMIVDLLRNDLGRICKPGTVAVQELFTVEQYETLLQMTSTVTGKLKPDISIYDMIKSLFPCGSVTGAPKIQSMKIIRNMEKEPRNIYTGAAGYFSPEGDAVFNVAIRTLDLQRMPDRKYQASMGVGGGIVFDSKPASEYEECKLKAKFLLNAIPDFALIETMLFEQGRVRYLKKHLARLKASADYFSIPCLLAKIRVGLKNYTAKLIGDLRLRLLLKANGDVLFEHRPLAAKPAKPVIGFSGIPTDSRDPFLYHKSTHRKLYDSEYEHHVTRGYFDVIFHNEKKQITEGAISNIFVKRRGRWYTPPLSCGLLCGIERDTMITKLGAREKILYKKDLQRADKILLTNSVRGATEVTLTPDIFILHRADNML